MLKSDFFKYLRYYLSLTAIALSLDVQAFVREIANDAISLKPIQVSEHVYYFRGESGVASQRNHGFMSNAGFVVTAKGVVVYDALATPMLGKAMIAAIAGITSQPIKIVIAGHYHADHIYGLQAFKEVGAEIWGHEHGRVYLASEAARLRLEQRRVELAPWVDAQTQVPQADRYLQLARRSAFDGAFELELGGLHLQIIDSSGAHSQEDLMLYVAEDKVLFAGDLFFSGRIPFVGSADSAAWLSELDAMLKIDARIAIPGHGGASDKVAKDIVFTRNYLRYLREKMGAAVQELMSFDEAYQQTDWADYRELPAFLEANRLNAYATYLLMEKENLQTLKDKHEH